MTEPSSTPAPEISEYQLGESARAGDIGALAYVDEERIVVDGERLEAGKTHGAGHGSGADRLSFPLRGMVGMRHRSFPFRGKAGMGVGTRAMHSRCLL